MVGKVLPPDLGISHELFGGTGGDDDGNEPEDPPEEEAEGAGVAEKD